jgi:hypothetical protein
MFVERKRSECSLQHQVIPLGSVYVEDTGAIPDLPIQFGSQKSHVTAATGSVVRNVPDSEVVAIPRSVRSAFETWS